MKTSNIILTIVIGSITLLIISGAFHLRFSGTIQSQDHDQSESKNSKTSDLKAFNTLTIIDSEVSIRFSDKPALQLVADEMLDLPEAEYRYEGDSLIIHKVTRSKENGYSNVILYLDSTQFYSIKSVNAHVKLKHCNSRTITLIMDHSDVSLWGKPSDRIEKLVIQNINSSNFNLNNNTLIDTLEIQMDNSYALLESNIGLVKGNISNHSNLSIKGVNEFGFTKDRTSRFTHWNE